MNEAASAGAAAVRTRENLLARAKGLMDAVRERSDETEETRRLAPETMQAMRDAGIHRILQPARHGGAEAHFSGMADIVETISIACSAAGWCLTQYCSHNCLLGYWPGDGQDEIWGATPDAMVAGVLIPSSGRAVRVDGGWRISGRWPFASGVYGADWFIATAFTEGDGVPKVAQMHAVPLGQFEIIDTWHTAGLRGTGSADVAVDDIFVPDRRALPIDSTKGGGDAPGCAVNDAALYKLPAFAMFSINQSIVAVGVAQATFDDFVARTRDRVARMSGKSMADYSTAQVKVAEAHTAIETARLLLHHCCDAGMAIAARGETRADAAQDGASRQGDHGGQARGRSGRPAVSSFGRRRPLRPQPDLAGDARPHCIRGHITQNWDVNASNHGRVLLGLPPPTRLFEPVLFLIPQAPGARSARLATRYARGAVAPSVPTARFPHLAHFADCQVLASRRDEGPVQAEGQRVGQDALPERPVGEVPGVEDAEPGGAPLQIEEGAHEPAVAVRLPARHKYVLLRDQVARVGPAVDNALIGIDPGRSARAASRRSRSGKREERAVPEPGAARSMRGKSTTRDATCSTEAAPPGLSTMRR